MSTKKYHLQFNVAMPLLILRYINALSYGKQDDAYT